tara:strand:+ start:117542 stop:118267 length:726 start_codon:yes stop_codon:yes gene_type:complete
MKFCQFGKSQLALLCVFALSAFLARPASAVLMVDFQSGVITAGGQQQIDVFLSSDSPAQDAFFVWDVIFSINEVPGSPPTAGTSVTFVDPMDESFIEDEPNYVLAGNSFQASIPPSEVYGDVLTKDADSLPFPLLSTVSAFDETANGNEVVVDTPKLLARLMVQHELGGATAAEVGGDVFTITLQSNPSFDVAFDGDDGPVDYRVGNIGLITVEAIAVPEPGSFAFIGLATLGLVRRRRRI